jgi:hypothetical protein
MPIIYNEASFKNSRVASRAPTTTANTYQETINLGPLNTLIAPLTPNRTYITIRSTATTSGDDIRYDYFDNPNMLTQGFLLKAGEACDLESPQAIYARAVANPVLCTIDEGEG